MLSGSDIRRNYSERIDILDKTATELEQSLKVAFQGFDRLDSIRSRVKTVESFVKKAQKQEEGKPKYQNPLNDIHDQIGCRIVVFYLSDLKEAERLALEEFHRIEIDHKQPEEASTFEYEATHFTCHIPQQIRQRLNSPIGFFELQIKTLFQHL
jgi:putative GTP pyrophosphokinase